MGQCGNAKRNVSFHLLSEGNDLGRKMNFTGGGGVFEFPKFDVTIKKAFVRCHLFSFRWHIAVVGSYGNRLYLRNAGPKSYSVLRVSTSTLNSTRH